jgi:hypothetical protein
MDDDVRIYGVGSGVVRVYRLDAKMHPLGFVSIAIILAVDMPRGELLLQIYGYVVSDRSLVHTDPVEMALVNHEFQESPLKATLRFSAVRYQPAPYLGHLARDDISRHRIASLNA